MEKREEEEVVGGNCKWKGKVVAVKSDYNSGGSGGGGGSSNGRKRGRPRRIDSLTLPLPLRMPPLIPPRKIDRTVIRYLFKKELKHSDVSQARRIVIPKMAAEAFLPKLYEKEGLFMSIDDLNGNQVWCFKFRFWPNNNSRMYVFENTGDFIEEHELTFGDYIYLYKDDENERYVIEAQKYKPPETENNSTFAVSGNYYYNNDANYFPFIDEMGMPYLDDAAITPTFMLSDGGSLPQMPTFDAFSFEDFP